MGEKEFVYVTREVYEALLNTFRREQHAQLMRDIRHLALKGYVEGETEEFLNENEQSLEDEVIHQMDLEILQKAIQSLTQEQKERLYLYFFKGKSIREIARVQGINRNAVWKSIQNTLLQLRSFFG